MKDDPERSPEVGIAPPTFRLPPATRLGCVRLQIRDLQRSGAFYRELLGLKELERSAGRAVLGHGGEDGALVELIEHAEARPARPGRRLGLYHVAILLPDRSDLGRFVRHATEAGVRLGMADHLVSEAVYLSDADGLGLEVYADRPRAAWRRKGAEIRMATDPLDVRSLIEAAGSEPWTGVPPGTTIGHVHLHVGRLDHASKFYHDAMGFDKVVWSYPGALFLSAGGYHHHLGTNEWAQGASPAEDDDARLLEWSLVLPTRAEVEGARQSMETAGYSTTEHAGAWTAADPWGTVVRVRV